MCLPSSLLSAKMPATLKFAFFDEMNAYNETSDLSVLHDLMNSPPAELVIQVMDVEQEWMSILDG